MAEKSESSSSETISKLNPVAQALLQGLYDENSELYKLKGMFHILRRIWSEITSYWKLHIKHTQSMVFVNFEYCHHMWATEEFKN